MAARPEELRAVRGVFGRLPIREGARGASERRTYHARLAKPVARAMGMQVPRCDNAEISKEGALREVEEAGGTNTEGPALNH